MQFHSVTHGSQPLLFLPGDGTAIRRPWTLLFATGDGTVDNLVQPMLCYWIWNTR
jgi:hypothetical protein